MKAKLKLARIGMNMEEGTIVAWRVTEGGSFKTGDVLYEVETEKVTNEVEAPGDGTLLQILVGEGEIAQVGQDVCVVESG